MFDDLINKLTLEEKVQLLTGATFFTLHANEKIGLRSVAFSDGPSGVRGRKFINGEKVALLPNATVLASAWDDELAHEAGGILAEEAKRQDIQVVLGPTINLHRTPLGGRLFEAYSEDPYLTGRTAAAYVRGLQDQHIAATLKHLIGNESEEMRNFMDSRISETALREVYLLPFQIAVQDAHPWAMMASYNDVNGVTESENGAIQNEIVKEEWDWDGLIMSDWFATKRTVASANGGLDLVMPGPNGPWGQKLVDAVERGEVSEATIDDHVRRLLTLAERVGALEEAGPSSAEAQTWPDPDSAERREQLRRMATRGMTLLKNNDGVLPLAAQTPLAVIGRAALETTEMGGGSAHVNPPYQVSIAEGLKTQFGDAAQIFDGVRVRRFAAPANLAQVSDPVTGEPGVRISYFAQDGSLIAQAHSAITKISAEPTDNEDLVGHEVAAIRFEALLHNQEGPVQLGGIGAGTWQVEAGEGAQKIELHEEIGFRGFDPGEAILRPPSFTEVVSLPANAKVTSTVTFHPIDWREVLAKVPNISIAEESHVFDMEGKGSVSFVAEPIEFSDDALLAQAERAATSVASQGGVALVVVGLTEEDETEAADKETLALPGRQDELVRRVAATGAPTVVVVNADTPILMPWLDEVAAVVVVGLPGQEGGNALADVITGRAEPTGRLVSSYPSADGAAPAWSTIPDAKNQVHYTDGVAIGYRGYEAGDAPSPLFWFGEGLGYGSWEYTGAKLVDSDSLAPALQVHLTNTSERESRETVQLYFAPEDPAQPTRLVGYTGVSVPSGQDVDVVVQSDPRLLRVWGQDGWRELESGQFLVARGLGDVRARLDWRR